MSARASDGGAQRSVYALVELTLPATAVSFQETLASRGRTGATTNAVSQLSAVNAEQTSFHKALAGAGLAGVKEIYRLQRIFNGVLYLTTAGNLAAIRALPGVRGVHILTPKQLDNAYGVPFVGVPALWSLGVPLHGENVKIGVIDTGIDYTHTNFGGTGVVDDYTNNDPKVVEPGTFPTAKVVGGWDFAGTDYNADNPATAVPVPDPDPLDGVDGGHGSHVAGTSAGFGVNLDGTTYAGSYDMSIDPATLKIGPGAAPKAALYALKVFGDHGGTTNVDSLALEWAVDPDGDGDFSDRLDVVNLSLGSNYGTPSNPESVMFRNAVRAGVVVVASAGNSADIYFISGSPASTPEVISVAATHHDHTQYPTVELTDPPSIAGKKRATTAAFTPANLPPVSGGLATAAPFDACVPLTNGVEVSGKIAFVTRGVCKFKMKVKNAQDAGAIGVIIMNNSAAPLLNMGDDPSITTPIAINTRMISQADGIEIQTALGAGAVTAILDDADPLVAAEEADNVAVFSSRGPSRVGSQVMLKPDIAAPGYAIASTGSGTGNGVETMNGTSMASPLVAGVMALLREAHPEWTPAELKALVMNTASHDLFLNATTSPTRPRVSPARVGAGRVDALNAVNSKTIAYDRAAPERVSVSFASVDVVGSLSETRAVRVRNTGATAVELDLTLDKVVTAGGTDVTLGGPAAITVRAGGFVDVPVTLTAEQASMVRAHDPTVSAAVYVDGIPRSWLSETSGYVVLTARGGGAPVLRVPYFAALNPASDMRATRPLGVTGTVGAADLELDGTPVDTRSLGAAAQEGVLSLATAFELAHMSPNDTPRGELPETYNVAETDNADLKHVGVTSNLPDVGVLANATIYFAVETYGRWGAPGDVEFDVYIKKAGAADWAYVLYNSDRNPQPRVPSDVKVTKLLPLPNGPAAPEVILNGLTAAEPWVPLYLSDVMVLPVKAASIGLTDTESEIEYQVVTWSRFIDFMIDSTPVRRYDPRRPAFAAQVDTTL